eukprot:gene38833-47956_t
MAELGEQFERAIDTFAADTGTTRSEYLSVMNKWPHCNKSVLSIMENISVRLRHQVAQVLGADSAWPVGAVMFRKTSMSTEAGNASTHAHQDISYARFPGSQMFRATTWVPLKMHNADTLCFAKGSHKTGIADIEDFLQVNKTADGGEESRTSSEPPRPHVVCDTVENVTLGDCILFDARVWHGSTPLPSLLEGDHSLRLAIGIQWLTAGGLDGLSPGVYFRWPESDIPKQIDLKGLRDHKVFGMDTAGHFLKLALVKLDESFCENSAQASHDATKTYSTLGLAEKFSQQNNQEVQLVLQRAGCDVTRAQDSLSRYVLFRRAARLHFGEAQGTKIFKPLYEDLIKPVLLTSELQE